MTDTPTILLGTVFSYSLVRGTFVTDDRSWLLPLRIGKVPATRYGAKIVVDLSVSERIRQEEAREVSGRLQQKFVEGARARGLA